MCSFFLPYKLTAGVPLFFFAIAEFFQKEFPVYSAGYGQIPKAFQFCIELLYDFVGIGFGNTQLPGYFLYSHKSVFVQIKYLLVLLLIFDCFLKEA